MKHITWTICATRTVDNKTVYGQVQRFDSKRAAVTAMESQRKDKTAVTRVGHDFLFVGRD